MQKISIPFLSYFLRLLKYIISVLYTITARKATDPYGTTSCSPMCMGPLTIGITSCRQLRLLHYAVIISHAHRRTKRKVSWVAPSNRTT